MIEYNGNEKEVEIPYGVEMIAENVFEKHTEIITVRFPKSLVCICAWLPILIAAILVFIFYVLPFLL